MKKSHGSSRNYKFGQKNNWRRTIWNEALSRTNGREQHDLSLYLTGPQDMDRAIAVEKGVPHHNLIAIDIDHTNIARVKAKSHAAIDADLIDVLYAWPQHRPVAVGVFDFCSGLEARTMDGLISALSRAAFYESVVVLNFQRGRDASTNSIRSLIVNYIHPTTGERLGDFPDGAFVALLRHSSVKCLHEIAATHTNRALQFIVCNLLTFANFFLEDDFMPYADFSMRLMAPTFISYRSGPLIFDSVVYRPITFKDYREIGIDETLEEKLESLVPKNRHVTHRLGAMLAVRTMRMAHG